MRALLLIASSIALLGSSAMAQQAPAPPPPTAQPPATFNPRYSPPYLHFDRRSVLDEAITHQFTRYAGYTHTRAVDLANAAGKMIDGGDCRGAAAYLETMGAPDMAARVPVTCDAKRRGLL